MIALSFCLNQTWTLFHFKLEFPWMTLMILSMEPKLASKLPIHRSQVCVLGSRNISAYVVRGSCSDV